VRLLLAALMAAMLAVVTTADRFACFDGCTDEAQHESQTSTAPSVCTLCHGWGGPLAVDIAAPTPLAVVRIAPVVFRELPAHVGPIEHPPRLA
jgi:hypothetical protein